MGFLGAGLVFLAAFLVYFAAPVRQVGDSRYTLLLSQALLERGSFDLAPYFRLPLEPSAHPGITASGYPYQIQPEAGRAYQYFPPGTALLCLPFVALARGLGLLEAGAYSSEVEEALQHALASLMMAGLACVFWATARQLLPWSWSLWVVGFGALGSPILSTGSRGLWSLGGEALLLGLAIHWLVRQRLRGGELPPVRLASALAWMYFVRPTASVPILTISLYVLAGGRTRAWPYVLTGLGWLAVFLGWSWSLHGSLLPGYYDRLGRLSSGHWLDAMSGNLLSPGRGLFVYMPFLGYVAHSLWRHGCDGRWRGLLLLALASVGLQLGLLSGVPFWWGGWTYGPRLLTGLTPWLVLLAILALHSHRPAGLERLAAGGLLALGVALHCVGACSSAAWEWNSRPSELSRRPERLWDWSHPQFLAFLQPWPWDWPTPLPARLPLGSRRAEPYLWGGWAEGEGEFRWTDGPRAELLFRGSPRGLRLRVRPFLARGRLLRQRLRLELNGARIGEFRLREAEARSLELSLPGSLLRERNRLVFETPDATSPLYLGQAPDARRLGIAVFWLEFWGEHGS